MSEALSKKKPAAREEKAVKENGTLAVFNVQGNKVGEVPSVFSFKKDPQVIAQAVQMYLLNKRKGLVSTKTRGEVSGGGKKPWRQKGTGRARVGSSRTPLWRHGGVVFGPHPRDCSYRLPAKIRSSALKAALNEKYSEGDVFVLDKIEVKETKTREVKGILDRLNIKDKVLFVLVRQENNLRVASRNMPNLKLALVKEVNALDVLRAKKIIFLQDALPMISERIGVNH